MVVELWITQTAKSRLITAAALGALPETNQNPEKLSQATTFVLIRLLGLMAMTQPLLSVDVESVKRGSHDQR